MHLSLSPSALSLIGQPAQKSKLAFLGQKCGFGAAEHPAQEPRTSVRDARFVSLAPMTGVSIRNSRVSPRSEPIFGAVTALPRSTYEALLELPQKALGPGEQPRYDGPG